MRAVIYRRVSSTKQEQGAGLEFQDDDCLAHCAKQKYTVVGNYVETHTGADLDERRVLWELRQSFRKKSFDVLVVWKLDRLSRKQVHQAVVLYEARKFGIRVESATEAVDDTPVGQFITQTHGFVAELELLKIKERTEAGRRKRAERGLPLASGYAPYGYEWGDDKKSHLVEIQPEANVTRRFWEYIAEGGSTNEFARMLNAEGIPTKTGKGIWTSGSFTHILRNPLYWGKPAAYRNQFWKETEADPMSGQTRTVKKRRLRDTPIPLPSTIAPALISEDLARRAHAQLKAHQKGTHRKFNPEGFPLRGHIYCGYCRRPMVCQTREGALGGDFYNCRLPVSTNYREKCIYQPAINVRVLEPQAWERINGYICHPETIPHLQEQNLPELPQRTSYLDQQHDYAAQLDNLLKNMRLVSGHAAERLAADVEELQRKQADVAKELAKLDELVGSIEERRNLRERLVQWCKTIDVTGDLPYDVRRKALRELGVKVYVWRKGHNPRWDVEPNPWNSVA